MRMLRAGLLAGLLSDVPWKPALHVAFVIERVGELGEIAAPLLCDEPDALGPVPRFSQVVVEALRAQSALGRPR